MIFVFFSCVLLKQGNVQSNYETTQEGMLKNRYQVLKDEIQSIVFPKVVSLSFIFT